MFRKFCLAIVGVCAFAHNANAIEIPSDFKYKGEAINARCFDVLGEVSDDSPRDLSKCSLERLQKDDTLFGPDFIGGIGEDGVSYSYYKYLGKAYDVDVIWWKGSGGGSGQFSAVLGVEKKGDTIRLRQASGAGDRCNFGIADASVKEGRIHQSVYVTYADLPRLAHMPVPEAESKKLSASAASCVAIAHFKGMLMEGVTILEDSDGEMPNAMDKCVKSKLLARAKIRGSDNLYLTEDELMGPVADFLGNCLLYRPSFTGK